MNEIPDDLIVKIGGYLVHLLYIERKDITGADWGDAFSDAIGGKHLDSPVSIADVILGKMAWSMKTVKLSSVRRCSQRMTSSKPSASMTVG